MSEWIDIKEREPELNQEIIAYTGYDKARFLVAGKASPSTKQVMPPIGYEFFTILKWMPLPELPKEGEE